MSKSITDRLREVRDVVSASKLDTDTYGFWLPLRRLEEEDDDGALLGLSLLDSVGIDLASDKTLRNSTKHQLSLKNLSIVNTNPEGS